MTADALIQDLISRATRLVEAADMLIDRDLAQSAANEILTEVQDEEAALEQALEAEGLARRHEEEALATAAAAHHWTTWPPADGASELLSLAEGLVRECGEICDESHAELAKLQRNLHLCLERISR